jgi:hypothetical protein
MTHMTPATIINVCARAIRYKWRVTSQASLNWLPEGGIGLQFRHGRVYFLFAHARTFYPRFIVL